MMKIAIHDRKGSFSDRWINYCQRENLDYKIVDVYSNNIIDVVGDCDYLLWHHQQSDPKDILFSKQLLFSLNHINIKVFPDFNSNWHFDDKVGQKYLLEAINAPMVKTFVFYTKNEALSWIDTTSFPKVFKLRGGAGAKNVKLVKTVAQARKLVHRAFGKGFRQYEPISNLKDRWRQFKEKKVSFWEVVKGLLRFFKEPEFSKTIGSERGYIYFQDFIPKNDFDLRIIVIGGKAFGIKRLVRKNDFRASGGGDIIYDKEQIDLEAVKIAFDTSKKLKSACIAYDFVFDGDKSPLIIEISYGFAIEAYDPCEGYWDEDLNWFSGQFNPQEWIIENLIEKKMR